MLVPKVQENCNNCKKHLVLIHCWLERNKYIISVFDIAVRGSACLLCVCVEEEVWVGTVAAARLKCTAASSRFCLSASCSLTPALSLSLSHSTALHSECPCIRLYRHRISLYSSLLLSEAFSI